MSHTEPTVEHSANAPALGALGMLRWFWAQLTSMRTALALLFLLALGAIPGSLIPQDSSPIKVSDFAKRHTVLNKIYSATGMYHVYTSPWFSAIYLLLFVSLIGCIVPRIGVYAKAVRSAPTRMPARLERLPEHGEFTLVSRDAEQALSDAEAWLKKKHYRTVRRDVTASGVTVPGISAERGYLREFGNLLFHLSAVFVLVGVAVNLLYGYKGTAQVITGQGFSNTITQYDQLSAGPLVDTDNLDPFTVVIKQFVVQFETGKVQTGAARKFDATVDVTTGGKTTTEHLQVNHPLDINGTRVHLLGHGYAANITVKDGNGNIAFSGPVVLQPVDGNFRSVGVIDVPDARPNRLGFQGFFLPTTDIDPILGPQSIFPDALNPALFLNAWSGPPKKETGVPQNVFVLNTTGMTQIKKGNDLLRMELKPGQHYVLPNHQGTITFNGWTRWANLQVSKQPGLWITVSMVFLAVAGLCLSLFVRPRRLWVRVVPASGTDEDAESPRVQVGGLDRADARTGLSDDVAGLLAAASGVDAGQVTVESSRWKEDA